VWIGDRLPAASDMQGLAAEVGDSETVFAVATGAGYTVRYYSPANEVPFCGHATIALGVALGSPGAVVLHTSAGEVRLDVGATGGRATLTSVDPYVVEPGDELVAEAMDLLGWSHRDLDTRLPPRIAFAGARHLILAAARQDRLLTLEYDFEGLRKLMLDNELITVALVHRTDERRFRARNAFAVGGVVEDPATGAAAAALGACLRVLRSIDPPVTLTVTQGVELGRPSELTIDVPPSGGVSVTGAAVPLTLPTF
ncbi:MAG: PhzF family phenazine biosynthesis protein, partial [Ilumatobacteraceae bacterium]